MPDRRTWYVISDDNLALYNGVETDPTYYGKVFTTQEDAMVKARQLAAENPPKEYRVCVSVYSIRYPLGPVEEVQL